MQGRKEGRRDLIDFVSFLDNTRREGVLRVSNKGWGKGW